MNADDTDIQLKFDGALVRELGGAPAELVANALLALQRMVHLIGMKHEGQAFSAKARPNAKVRREYAVVCRAAIEGSHLQPFDVASASGVHTAAAAFARQQLLGVLRAFDSDDDQRLASVLPDVRQRWFLADAAQGLLPRGETQVEVSVRAGKGRYAFVAARAKPAIERAREGEAPALEHDQLVGRLKALDFAKTLLTVKPVSGRQVSVRYPLKIEPFLQRNVRRRLGLVGAPLADAFGRIVGFADLSEIVEMEPGTVRIESFPSPSGKVLAIRPFGYLVGYDLSSSMYFARDPEIGLDVYHETLDELEAEVRSDLAFLWRTYALAEEVDLTQGAKVVRAGLRHRFRAAP